MAFPIPVNKPALFFLVSRNRGYTNESFTTLEAAREWRAVFAEGDILRCYGTFDQANQPAEYRIVGVEAPEGN